MYQGKSINNMFTERPNYLGGPVREEAVLDLSYEQPIVLPMVQNNPEQNYGGVRPTHSPVQTMIETPTASSSATTTAAPVSTPTSTANAILVQGQETISKGAEAVKKASKNYWIIGTVVAAGVALVLINRKN